MKKRIKKFIACVSILATLATGILPASAIYIESDYPAYEAWAEKTIASGYQRSEVNPNVFYKQRRNQVYQYSLIVVNFHDNTKVTYATMTEYCEELTISIDLKDSMPTDEEVANFLAENNLKATLSDENQSDDLSIKLKYDEDVTSYEDIHYITDALREEFGLYEMCTMYVTAPTTVYFVSQTVAGDLNLDDEQGISDIVALTKYTASPELYPITDATALANADVNQDGTIDALDTNMLIEMTLGSYENADQNDNIILI